MDNTKPIVLIACSKSKVDTDGELVPVGELYTGDLFLKAKAYAQAIGADWFVLSAKHRVIRPDRRVYAYDDTLAELDIDKRRFWAREVAHQLRPMKDRHLIVLAGKLYCGWTDGFDVERPLAGLAIGKAKQRLLAMLHEVRA